MADRERPSWLATVAHELRGPMSALETASELLDRDLDDLDDQQIRVMVSGIHRRTLWMRGLMDNLLCSVAIREGRLRVHPRPLDMVEAAREIEDVLAPVLRRKRQTLRLSADAHCLPVEADRNRIAQVLLNLLSNANKYAGEGAEIEVSVTSGRGQVRVSVSDRGPGLPAGREQGVFRAYDRAGRTDSEGLGIGLWVVRSIVHAHGGRVGAFNREGGGATFWFSLRAAAPRPPAEATATAGLTMTTEGMSAL